MIASFGLRRTTTDLFSQQASGISTITGGGAKAAEDKVVQHNGGGTVVIENYCVSGN